MKKGLGWPVDCIKIKTSIIRRAVFNRTPSKSEVFIPRKGKLLPKFESNPFEAPPLSVVKMNIVLSRIPASFKES